jgi:hypothetical protein
MCCETQVPLYKANFKVTIIVKTQGQDVKILGTNIYEVQKPYHLITIKKKYG